MDRGETASTRSCTLSASIKFQADMQQAQNPSPCYTLLPLALGPLPNHDLDHRSRISKSAVIMNFKKRTCWTGADP